MSSTFRVMDGHWNITRDLIWPFIPTHTLNDQFSVVPLLSLQDNGPIIANSRTEDSLTKESLALEQYLYEQVFCIKNRKETHGFHVRKPHRCPTGMGSLSRKKQLSSLGSSIFLRDQESRDSNHGYHAIIRLLDPPRSIGQWQLGI